MEEEFRGQMLLSGTANTSPEREWLGRENNYNKRWLVSLENEWRAAIQQTVWMSLGEGSTNGFL